MKKLKSAFLMLTICVLALGACKKDKDETPESSLSAKVNGVTNTAISKPMAALMEENTLQITGQFTSASGVSLTITNPKVGTFDIESDHVIALYQLTNEPGFGYLGTEGSVTITEWSDTRVKGTFQFTGKFLETTTTVKITEGKFDVKVLKM